MRLAPRKPCTRRNLLSSAIPRLHPPPPCVSVGRQAVGKITKDGVFIEHLETDPAKYLPEVKATDLTSEAVKVDLNQPMANILAQLSKYGGAWGGGCFCSLLLLLLFLLGFFSLIHRFIP